ncbi:hypothetical protein [Nocardia sp. NPDC052566]|uniref:hypothetical protein n=1 Tax=Nocardia sp. NPDC052566 TaxID=3364330 RepID=UPI0037C9E343
MCGALSQNLTRGAAMALTVFGALVVLAMIARLSRSCWLLDCGLGAPPVNARHDWPPDTTDGAEANVESQDGVD